MDGPTWLIVLNVVQTVALAWIARCTKAPQQGVEPGRMQQNAADPDD